MTIATKGDDMVLRTAQVLAHRRNIQRYGRLLATDLTDLERQYLHKRIAEEQVALDRLAMENDRPPRPPQADVSATAAAVLGKREDRGPDTGQL
jgi:hypothetical protein